MNIETKIQNLEIKFTHVDEYTKELNKVILEQGEEIAALKRELETLNAKLEGEDEPLLENEKPPHY